MIRSACIDHRLWCSVFMVYFWTIRLFKRSFSRGDMTHYHNQHSVLLSPSENECKAPHFLSWCQQKQDQTKRRWVERSRECLGLQFSERKKSFDVSAVTGEGPWTPGAFVTIVVCNEGRLFPDTLEKFWTFDWSKDLWSSHLIGSHCFYVNWLSHSAACLRHLHPQCVHYWCKCVLIYDLLL